MVITMNRFLFYQASQGITGAFHMIILMLYTTIKMSTNFLALPRLSCNLSTCKHHLESLIRDTHVAHYSPYDQISLSLSHSLSSEKRLRGGNNRGNLAEKNLSYT